MEFRYDGYVYWFSVIDCCYYKQKIDSFYKEEISKEDFYNANDQYWKQLV